MKLTVGHSRKIPALEEYSSSGFSCALEVEVPDEQSQDATVVQQWLHDFEIFEDFSPAERDDIIGRRRSDNEELGDAPPSAHVKRTAQEDFAPPAFLVRRSMPWVDEDGEGLLFIAFGRSLDAFDAQLLRMTGAEDGVVDGLFRFTRPITGGFYWCPPRIDGRLDLRAIAG